MNQHFLSVKFSFLHFTYAIKFLASHIFFYTFIQSIQIDRYLNSSLSMSMSQLSLVFYIDYTLCSSSTTGPNDFYYDQYFHTAIISNKNLNL